MDEPKPKKRRLSKNWIIGIILAVFVLAGFYWVAIRPVILRHSCSNVALEKAREKYISGNPDYFRYSDYDFFYKTCLQRRFF